MSAENADTPSPVEFFAESLGMVIAFASLMTLFTAVSVVPFISSKPPALQFALVSILSYSLAASQHLWKRADNSKTEYTRTERVVGVLLSFVHFNLVVWISVFVGTTLAPAYSPALATMAVVGYSFWDVETRARGIPVSAGGVIVFSLVVAIILRKRGRAAVERLRSLDYETVIQTHSITNPSAISILEFPERKQFDFAAKHLRR